MTTSQMVGLLGLACTAATCVGLLRLSRAGRAERGGRLDDARALARRAVPAVASGSVGSVALLFGGAAAGVLPVGGTLPAGIALLALAGGTGVLAGLAGKPRPSVGFAWIMQLGGSWLVAIALGAGSG